MFLYHMSAGIIAAGKVKSEVKKDEGTHDAFYRDLEWLTARPVRDESPKKFMRARQIKKTLDRNFFWARTIKTPYLSQEESKKLLEALIDRIGPKP